MGCCSTPRSTVAGVALLHLVGALGCIGLCSYLLTLQGDGLQHIVSESWSLLTTLHLSVVVDADGNVVPRDKVVVSTRKTNNCVGGANCNRATTPQTLVGEEPEGRTSNNIRYNVSNNNNNINNKANDLDNYSNYTSLDNIVVSAYVDYDNGSTVIELQTVIDNATYENDDKDINDTNYSDINIFSPPFNSSDQNMYGTIGNSSDDNELNVLATESSKNMLPISYNTPVFTESYTVSIAEDDGGSTEFSTTVYDSTSETHLLMDGSDGPLNHTTHDYDDVTTPLSDSSVLYVSVKDPIVTQLDRPDNSQEENSTLGTFLVHDSTGVPRQTENQDEILSMNVSTTIASGNAESAEESRGGVNTSDGSPDSTRQIMTSDVRVWRLMTDSSDSPAAAAMAETHTTEGEMDIHVSVQLFSNENTDVHEEISARNVWEEQTEESLPVALSLTTEPQFLQASPTISNMSSGENIVADSDVSSNEGPVAVTVIAYSAGLLSTIASSFTTPVMESSTADIGVSTETDKSWPGGVEYSHATLEATYYSVNDSWNDAARTESNIHGAFTTTGLLISSIASADTASAEERTESDTITETYTNTETSATVQSQTNYDIQDNGIIITDYTPTLESTTQMNNYTDMSNNTTVINDNTDLLNNTILMNSDTKVTLSLQLENVSSSPENLPTARAFMMDHEITRYSSLTSSNSSVEDENGIVSTLNSTTENPSPFTIPPFVTTTRLLPTIFTSTITDPYSTEDPELTNLLQQLWLGVIMLGLLVFTVLCALAALLLLVAAIVQKRAMMVPWLVMEWIAVLAALAGIGLLTWRLLVEGVLLSCWWLVVLAIAGLVVLLLCLVLVMEAYNAIEQDCDDDDIPNTYEMQYITHRHFWTPTKM